LVVHGFHSAGVSHVFKRLGKASELYSENFFQTKTGGKTSNIERSGVLQFMIYDLKDDYTTNEHEWTRMRRRSVPGVNR